MRNRNESFAGLPPPDSSPETTIPSSTAKSRVVREERGNMGERNWLRKSRKIVMKNIHLLSEETKFCDPGNLAERGRKAAHVAPPALPPRIGERERVKWGEEFYVFFDKEELKKEWKKNTY
jgi:hypothetical protein